MLVIKKQGNSNDNDDSSNDNVIGRRNISDNIRIRSAQHSYNVMLYILKNFSDLSLDDQYIVFSKMTFIKIKKKPFEALKNKVLADYNQNVNQESITVTDLKAAYHLSNGMLEMHLDSIDQINDQLYFYENEFVKEKEKSHPNIDQMVKMSLVVERLINRRSVLNVGTPIILFFRYQDKKQKIEMQQIKEKYDQRTLDKLELPDQNPKTLSKTDIAVRDTVTNNDIDELEHYAKLQDPRYKPTRGNTNRQDNKSSNEELRVQSVTDDNSTTSIGGQDPSSDSYRSSNERRTKEAKF